MTDPPTERREVQTPEQQNVTKLASQQPSQEELRIRYLQQQQRLRCIGCGEREEVF